MVVSAWCLGVLNTHRRFFLPYAAPALWNVAGIAAMVGAAAWLKGEGLYGLSLALPWGTEAGCVLQLVMQLRSEWRRLSSSHLRLGVGPERIRQVITSCTPLGFCARAAKPFGLLA